jgi:hypothetical protein
MYTHAYGDTEMKAAMVPSRASIVTCEHRHVQISLAIKAANKSGGMHMHTAIPAHVHMTHATYMHKQTAAASRHPSRTRHQAPNPRAFWAASSFLALRGRLTRGPYSRYPCLLWVSNRRCTGDTATGAGWVCASTTAWSSFLAASRWFWRVIQTLTPRALSSG